MKKLKWIGLETKIAKIVDKENNVIISFVIRPDRESLSYLLEFPDIAKENIFFKTKKSAKKYVRKYVKNLIKDLSK